MHKINYENIEIADSEYRIGSKLLSTKPTRALKIHLTLAFEIYGEFMYWEKLVDKMKVVWQNYEEQEIQEPKLKDNLTIKQITICNKYF